MINWISRIFHKKNRENDKNEWLEPLFENIESACFENKTFRFKICSLKPCGFVVKVGGLFAFLPFKFMPWQYQQSAHWNIISPTLEGKLFYCKILEATKIEEQKFRILIDASIHLFREIKLQENLRYTGIILQKFGQGITVDIGCHFDWEYGTLKGFVPVEKFADLKTFQDCEPGQMIDVMYVENTLKGIKFAEAGYADLYSEYVGKMVWVKVYRAEDASLKFRLEDKYDAILPILPSIYSPQMQKQVQRRREGWRDGDIIDCEVLHFNPPKGFAIKWIKNNSPGEIDWYSEEMEKFIGKEIVAEVYKLDEQITFLVENKYPAVLSNTHCRKHNISDGDTIICQIRSIDYSNQFFRAKWKRHKSQNGPLHLYSIGENIDDKVVQKLNQLTLE
jgi:ribosomal protein S1